MFTAGDVFIVIAAKIPGRFSGNPKLFSRTRVEDQRQLFAALRDTPWFCDPTGLCMQSKRMFAIARAIEWRFIFFESVRETRLWRLGVLGLLI